jgi:hypothetical protein
MMKKVALPRLVSGVVLALAMFMTVKLQAVSVTITAAAVCDQQTGAFRISYTASQALTYTHNNPSVNILFDGVIVDNDAFIGPTYSFSDTLNAPAGKGAGDTVTVTVDVVGMWDNGVQPPPGAVTASTTVTLPDACTPPVLFRGCTPGYWKQSQHFDSWPAGYSPYQSFDSLPGFDNAYPGMTLLQVLSQGGGGLAALGRHTVAALLNSASGIGVDLTALQNAFNDNWENPVGAEALHLILARLNELGCPFN